MFGSEGAAYNLPDRTTNTPTHSTAATELSLVAQVPNADYNFDKAASVAADSDDSIVMSVSGLSESSLRIKRRQPSAFSWTIT